MVSVRYRQITVGEAEASGQKICDAATIGCDGPDRKPTSRRCAERQGQPLPAALILISEGAVHTPFDKASDRLHTGLPYPDDRDPIGASVGAGHQDMPMDDRVEGLFSSAAPFAICGPCVIESHDHLLRTARAVALAGQAAGLAVVFKASFDKANRTSLTSYRGPGATAGLEVLADVRCETGLPVLTDIHQPDQAELAAQACDILQIPAFLCRQTDLLVAAGDTGRVVNIKKGQFLAPGDMRHAVDKVASTGNERILITERGSSFGYRNLVVDFRGVAEMLKLGRPVVLDVTHSLQLPGAAGGSSGGQPEYIEPLARAGASIGVSGVFLEVHEEPSKALSDGANALRLDLLPKMLARFVEIRRLVDSWQPATG